MFEELEEDLGPHSLLNPEGPKFTSALTQRALIVWNQLGRRNKFIDVYRFYKAIDKSESALSSRSRDASQKLDFDLINTEPPTTTYLNEYFPNLYPDKRDFMVPAELKDSQYINTQAPNLQQALASQANFTSNITATSINNANNTITANEDVIFVSQMMRDYCIAHKTTLKEFILEFKAYADKYGVNATVSNVAFYMQYRTAVEQRGLPFNGIVNQNIPVQVPKNVSQNSAQSIDVMEIFDNAVKNINNYGNSDYYQNLMTAYNYNGVEVVQAFNGNSIPAPTTSNLVEIFGENSIPKSENIVRQNGNADYSAILKKNIIKTDVTNGKSTPTSVANNAVTKIPFDSQNNKEENLNENSNNGQIESKNTVAEIISKNGNQTTIPNNSVADSSYDNMSDIWNQLSSVTIDPNTSFNNNSGNSTQPCKVKTIERTPDKLKITDHSEELNVTPGKKDKKPKNKSEHGSNPVHYKSNSNGKSASPRKVGKDGGVKKGMDDSNHSSFYLDAESSFSGPDSSIEEFDRFKLISSTSFQER